MRTAARIDDNQNEIVVALRQLGASVQVLSMVGKGAPDLLVGRQGRNYLLEIKDGAKAPSKRRLTPDEQAWHDNWRGTVIVVENIEEAIYAVMETDL